MEFFTGEIPEYLPFPKFLLEMELSATAKIVYAVLLHRAVLSQRNGWHDESGRVYVIFTVDKLAETAHKGQTAIKQALSDLHRAGLIERNKRRLYVKVAGNPTTLEAKNSRKTDHKTDGNPTAK